MSNPIKYRYNRIIFALLTLVLLIGTLFIYVDYSKISSNDVSHVHEGLQNQPSLTFKNRVFYLRGHSVQILSGAVHYFRIHRKYWRDRLLQLKAAGFNTVDTCIPWNLHERSQGSFNFHGDFNIRKFCKIAQEVGLHVILKPGPFVGSQIDFGGLPGWLLKDPNMRVRSMYMGFTRAVDNYFQMLMHQLVDLQASNGGPVIAMQLEHEYGSFGENLQYVHFLRHTLRKYGATEAFFACESADGIGRHRRLEGNFVGINFNDVKDGRRLISQVQAWDRNLPIFVSELWTGRYLTWGAFDRNDVIRAKPLVEMARQLASAPLWASLSLHMFAGGSNFGFSGASSPTFWPGPVATSHDWDAPVSERGEATLKYRMLADLFAANSTPRSGPLVLGGSQAYGSCAIESSMQWNTLVGLVEYPRLYEEAKFMEDIGQNFGFILYRSTFQSGQVITIDGYVADRGQVLVNGEPLDSTNPFSGLIHGQSAGGQAHLSLKRSAAPARHGDPSVLDLLVENMGRASQTQFESPEANAQRKGLCSAHSVNAEHLQVAGSLLVNERPVMSYKIYSLPFDSAFVAKASVQRSAWTPYKPVAANCTAPGLYRATLTLTGQPSDTFLDMSAWVKGQVFVNGFNLGRYWIRGPQRTLYVPGPLLRQGANEIIIFELHKPANTLTFVDSSKFVFPV